MSIAKFYRTGSTGMCLIFVLMTAAGAAQTTPGTATGSTGPNRSGGGGSGGFGSGGPTDPGPRKGSSGAGGAYPTLNTLEQMFFGQAQTRFQALDSVTGSIPGEPDAGLGPTFNGNGCAVCHAQPAAGGSSPGLQSPQSPKPNPQVALATLHGANNTVPAFITVNGPVREARFVSDGGVHGLYTIAGRSDAPGCQLAQPDFKSALSSNNVIFRIPTPVFGLGLVENTPDAVLQANLVANQSQKTALGITGRFNTSGNDGTITRFGWKAQNKSLLIFAGEAYNVEQGVSNDAFPNKRSAVSGCVFNPTPEDGTDLTDFSGSASKLSSDIVNFAMFMRMLAPATPTTSSSSEQNGSAMFNSIGCVLCHSSTLKTAASPLAGLSNEAYHPYSDFALHSMGSALADGISQGAAGPSEFRTAPLWGVGQRLFFLHDGRTADLMDAIQDHASSGSEATGVINNFNHLPQSQQQDILNFLRSL
jgi:CxxC motif-containing protein (DUF1111 family)